MKVKLDNFFKYRYVDVLYVKLVITTIQTKKLIHFHRKSATSQVN